MKYDSEPNTTHDKKGFFTSDFYTDNLIHYLKERTGETREKPFFAYLPFSAPHWPLQCSKEDRERYKGVYDDGPDALRLKRLARLQELGLVPKDVKPHDVVAGPMNTEWDEMSDYERKCSARSMECFAGMVDNIDQNVGKVIRYLKETGEFESKYSVLATFETIDNYFFFLIPFTSHLDTLIVFQSDNGAEGATYEAIPTMGADLTRVINEYCMAVILNYRYIARKRLTCVIDDNSLENIGNANSFAWYGTRVSQKLLCH